MAVYRVAPGLQADVPVRPSGRGLYGTKLVAAVVLNRALHAIRRGGGLPMTLIRLCGFMLARGQRSAPGRIALKIAFMLLFTGNGDVLGILFRLQMDWLIERMQPEVTMGSVQTA